MTDSNDDHSVTAEFDESPDDDFVTFAFDDWRAACAPQAVDAIEELWRQSRHDIQPLPVYDVDGRLLMPKDYKNLLPQAVVHVTFYASHQLINSIHNENYYGEISKIQILQRAPEKNLKRASPLNDRNKRLRKILKT